MATKTETKEQTAPSATAVAEPDPPAAVPQTAAEIAATEQALGLTPPAKPNGGTTTQALAVKASVRMGVAPTNVEEAWRMAQFIAKSELVPKQYRERPADVLVAIQYGMEVGLPPMAALHSIFVTNGRPSLWGDGLLAVIMAAPVYKDHMEFYVVDGVEKDYLVAADLTKDDTMAVTTFWRKDSARGRTATFSIAKAKKAGLWSKSGPWQEYPDRMLRMRARGFAAHDCFPDVLKGMRSAEEVIDLPPEETEPPREVRRISESPAPERSSVSAEVAKIPSIDQVVFDKTTVVRVEQFLGGYTVTLGDGSKVDTTEMADAGELEKFIDTPNKVRVICSRASDGNLQLVSFGIAD